MVSLSQKTSSPRGAGALLLAAGRGTRLRPLTDVLAKPALPILDLPLGAWGLDALERSSPPVVVNASHLAQTVAAALAPSTLDHGDVAVAAGPRLMLERPEPFGTGGTLRALRHEVADRLVAWNSDSLTDLDLEALLEAHDKSEARATIAVVHSVDHGDFETVRGRVTGIIDRRRERCAGARFMGVAVYERNALELLDDRVPLGATEGLLKPLLETGELHVFEHHGYWLDVGTPARYLDANQDALEGGAPAPPRPWPGEVVDVVGGRAYVGPGADAEIDSLGPGAVLLAGSIVETRASVTRSVVWPGERVPAGTSLDRCIWFDGRALPTGAES